MTQSDGLGDDVETVTCAVEISKHDYAVMNQSRMALATRGQWVRSLIFTAFIPVIGTWVVVSLTNFGWLPIAVLMVGAVAGAAALSYRYSGRMNAFFYYNSYRVEKSENRYVLSPDGLRVSSKTFDGHFPWSAFHSIFRTDSHYLLWLNPMQAHIIPFRTLDDDKIERVWAMVKDLPTARYVKVRA